MKSNLAIVATLGVVFAAAAGSSATAVIPAPTWITANSVSTGDQDNPAVAFNRSGDAAVVWEDDRDATNPEDNAHSNVFLRLFRNGVAAYELDLSGGGTAGTNWRHLDPDVGLDDKGNAVVVWAEDGDGNGGYNIAYRVVSPAGAITAQGTVNTNGAGQQTTPRVAVDPDGTPTTQAVAFTVVWADDLGGTAGTFIRAAGYTGPTTRAWEVTASQTTGTHSNPDVGVSASGDAVVAWEEDYDANGGYNIGLVRLAKANGAANLSIRLANANGAGQQKKPTVAANFNGDFAVAWESDHTGTAGTWTRSFKSDGAPRYSDVQVATGAKDPSIGIDDRANTLVGWTTQAATLDVWVRGFWPDGTTTTRLVESQQLMVNTAGRQEHMTVAVSPWSEVAIAYTDDNDNNSVDQVYLGGNFPNNSW